MALFYATSADGMRFTPRQRMPTEGFPRHAQITLGSKNAVIAAWEEQEGGTRRVVIARALGQAGSMQFVREPVSDPEPAVYPALATTADGIVAVWTSGSQGQSVLRTARFPYQ